MILKGFKSLKTTLYENHLDNLRINQVEDVNNVVVLKDFHIAEEKCEFENGQERIFQGLFSYRQILFRTAELKGLHE
jgi:hypothetical protein